MTSPNSNNNVQVAPQSTEIRPTIGHRDNSNPGSTISELALAIENGAPQSERAPPTDDENTEAEIQRRKNIMDALVRKARLEADPWTSEVKETSVQCNGCKKTIKLDGRYLFYRGLWEKHRDLCRVIKMLKGEDIPKVSVLFIHRLDRISRS